ncbi:unnamed protein product [Nippostrongylus brasiliensis]|uniref:Tick transposon n=1 Tax=Nippostrongylus brasiliensis TaxID=27835 RepID=A0A0N4XP77_NIPBR|nr:unnamed protein product [Nippostrongylus brasiliensis]
MNVLIGIESVVMVSQAQRGTGEHRVIKMDPNEANPHLPLVVKGSSCFSKGRRCNITKFIPNIHTCPACLRHSIEAWSQRSDVEHELCELSEEEADGRTATSE